MQPMRQATRNKGSESRFVIQQFIARKSTLTPFLFLFLLTACAGSDKSANDYQLLEGVYKKTAASDQQKIADLNKEVLGLQQELGKERGARKAAEARATDVERRL